ncbi:MAG: FG-GAP-like repeat-containing protein [Burkholderiales bacterium]
MRRAIVRAALVALAVGSGLACAQFRTIPLAGFTGPAVLHESLGKLYVVDGAGVAVVDTSALTVIGNISMAQGALLLDEANNRLYVLHTYGGPPGVDVIDTLTDAVLVTIPVPGASDAMAYNPLTRRLYVASQTGVAVLDMVVHQVVATVPAGPADRRWLCVNEATNRIYVVGTYADNVTVIDGATNAQVTGSPVAVGHRPWTCAVDAVRNRVIVGNYESASLSVIDGAANTITATIPVNGAPMAALADESLNLLAIGGGRTVSLFDLDKLAFITEVDVGLNNYQRSFAVDPVGPALIVNPDSANGRPFMIELRRFAIVTDQGGSGHTLIPHRNRCFVIRDSVRVFKCPSLHRGWDVNDDGYSDIAWYNTATKENALTLMSGTTIVDSAVTLGPSDWIPVVRADLDGDGHGDLVFRNSTTQATAAWFMNGMAPRPGGSGVILGPSSYLPVFAVECGYGIARCLVWRDTVSGSVAYWYMPNGPSPEYAQVIYAGGTGWSLVHTGDFDGDDYTDLVWQHSDGRVAVWLMQGDTTAGFSAKAAAVILGRGSGWVPKIVADFDGDGLADILWQHAATNTTAVWLMDGMQAKVGGTLVVMDGATGWTVTHAETDSPWNAWLLWRHLNGSTAASYSVQNLYGDLLSSDPDWRVTHAGHFDVNGQPSLLWHNSASGQTHLWTGVAPFPRSAILSGDPNWRVVPGD